MDEPAPSEDQLRRTMRYWLGRELRELRERKGIGRQEVATLAQVDPSTLSRFEAGKTWPQKTDSLVAVYAQLCGIEDARELWKRAIKRYISDGGAPTLGELTPQLRALRLALEASPRFSPDDGESPGAPSAKRKNSKGG